MDLRALVADDERLAREELCFLLGRLDRVQVVGAAGDGEDAVRLAQELEPDLVLLDVQMPGLTGFDVARRLLEHTPVPEIVFVTAFDQFAIEAFDVNAVDYLLKPVELARLDQALQRVRRRLTSDRGQGFAALPNQDLERIVQLVTERRNRRNRLALKVGERFVLVQADEIIHASVTDDVITITTANLAGTSNFRTLDELHASLDPDVFWRVHRSHLVNINKIKEIVPWFSRNYILKMRDPRATEIPVSRSQTKRLREYLRL
jgi:two-component system, LytTR family, response regulator LytT